MSRITSLMTNHLIPEIEQDRSSTLSTMQQDISERSTPSSLPDIPNPDTDPVPEDTISSNKHFYEGLKQLKPWSSLPEILKKDKKKIMEVEGAGYVLLESIIAALYECYKISYSKDEIIQLMSKELVQKPDYTKYMRLPITQEEVDFNLLSMTTTKKYSRLIADIYLPAISTALNIHFRTIQNVSGYFAVMNTLPIKTNPWHKKVITLIIHNGKYQPVVNISEEDIEGTLPTPTIASESPLKNTESWQKVKTWSRGKKIIVPEEVIVISDEETTSAVVIPPQEPLPVPDSPPPIMLEDPYQDLLHQADNLIENLKQEPVEEPLSEIKWEEAVRSKYSNKRLYFDMKPYKGMVPAVVREVPHDVDGLKYYIIDVPEEEPFCTKYRDGRYFELHSSTRKGFRGVRRVGKCRGNYICTNTSCAYLLETKKNNQHQFTTIGKNKFCFVCNSIVYRKPCPALKLIEFNMAQRMLEVYHQGTHTCNPKPETTANDKEIEDSVKKYGAKVTPKEMAQMRMTEELKKQFDSGVLDMDKIVDIGAQFTDRKRISMIKSRIQNEMKSEKHSMSAVAELKTCTDTSDKFLIYKVHDQNMAGTGKSYVFKSSRRMANLMLNMDQNREQKNPLMSEPVYFDGMHKRCAGWKTLTLWVHHPSPRKLMRLATMEVQGETSESTALFWQNINAMLQEVKGDETVYFNPYMFITDEAGANANGITKVFGQEGYDKSRTCQFHFKQSLNRMLTKFPEDAGELKVEFEMLMKRLCTVPTLGEYEEIKSRLLEICALLPSLENGVQWWLARRYNLFPVFRGYCIASVNMAEIGHSTLKRKKPLALVDACWEDVCTTILQEQEHTQFLAGRGFSFGKGPTQGDKSRRERREQMKRAREYSQAFNERVINITEEFGGPLIPDKRARHRQPDQQVFTVQGHVQEGDTENENPNPTIYPPISNMGRALGLNDNPPLLAFLQGFKISVCYGCKNKFGPSLKQPPNDLIVKMQVKRDRLVNNKWIPGWKKSWAYFHLALGCLKIEKSVLEIEDIYIPNDIRDSLTPGHISKLRSMGWWDKLKKRC